MGHRRGCSLGSHQEQKQHGTHSESNQGSGPNPNPNNNNSTNPNNNNNNNATGNQTFRKKFLINSNVMEKFTHFSEVLKKSFSPPSSTQNTPRADPEMSSDSSLTRLGHNSLENDALSPRNKPQEEYEKIPSPNQFLKNNTSDLLFVSQTFHESSLSVISDQFKLSGRISHCEKLDSITKTIFQKQHPSLNTSISFTEFLPQTNPVHSGRKKTINRVQNSQVFFQEVNSKLENIRDSTNGAENGVETQNNQEDEGLKESENNKTKESKNNKTKENENNKTKQNENNNRIQNEITEGEASEKKLEEIQHEVPKRKEEDENSLTPQSGHLYEDSSDTYTSHYPQSSPNQPKQRLFERTISSLFQHSPNRNEPAQLPQGDSTPYFPETLYDNQSIYSSSHNELPEKPISKTSAQPHQMIRQNTQRLFPNDIRKDMQRKPFLGKTISQRILDLHGKKASTSEIDWNQEFQTILSSSDSIEKYQKLSDLSDTFSNISSAYVQVIISELHLENNLKTIKIAGDVSGVAGGLKFIKNKIFFKLASDFQSTNRKWVYGGKQKDTESAQKSVNHELRSASAVLEVNTPGLHIPLVCRVDFRGYRVLAVALIGLTTESPIYGSNDGGKTVQNVDLVLSEKIEHLALNLNLRPHLCGKQKVSLFTPTDIEGHRCDDGRYYLIDLARLFPAQKPGGTYLYHLLRPELVRRSPVPISSDANSPFNTFDPDSRQMDADVQRLVELMHNQIENYAHELEESDLSTSDPFIQLSHIRLILNHLHNIGINWRFLGTLYNHLKLSKAKTLLITEMIARICKNEFRDQLREQSNRPFAVIASECFNNWFNYNNSRVWTFDFPNKVNVKYGFNKNQIVWDSWDCSLPALFLRLLDLLQIELEPTAMHSFLHRPLQEIHFSSFQFLRMGPKISHLGLLDIAQELGTIMQASKEENLKKSVELLRTTEASLKSKRMATLALQVCQKLLRSKMTWLNEKISPLVDLDHPFKIDLLKQDQIGIVSEIEVPFDKISVYSVFILDQEKPEETTYLPGIMTTIHNNSKYLLSFETLSKRASSLISSESQYLINHFRIFTSLTGITVVSPVPQLICLNTLLNLNSDLTEVSVKSLVYQIIAALIYSFDHDLSINRLDSNLIFISQTGIVKILPHFALLLSQEEDYSKVVHNLVPIFLAVLKKSRTPLPWLQDIILRAKQCTATQKEKAQWFLNKLLTVFHPKEIEFLSLNDWLLGGTLEELYDRTILVLVLGSAKTGKNRMASALCDQSDLIKTLYPFQPKIEVSTNPLFLISQIVPLQIRANQIFILACLPFDTVSLNRTEEFAEMIHKEKYPSKESLKDTPVFVVIRCNDPKKSQLGQQNVEKVLKKFQINHDHFFLVDEFSPDQQSKFLTSILEGWEQTMGLNSGMNFCPYSPKPTPSEANDQNTGQREGEKLLNTSLDAVFLKQQEKKV